MDRRRAIAAIVAAQLLFLLPAGTSLAQTRGRVVAVSVAPVVQRDVAATRSFVGTVMPARVSTVGSAVAGRVAEFLVQRGQRVEQGQVLARLQRVQAEIQLAGAQAELALRQAALEQLQNGSRPEEIKQAEARYLSAQAASRYAHDRYQRIKELHRRGTITDEELDSARAAQLQALQAQLEAEAGWQLAKQGPRQEQIAQAAASVAVQAEQVRYLEDLRDKHTIVAPFDGYIVEEFTEVGQWLTQAGSVVTIVELDEVDIEAPIPEDHLAAITVGTPATITLPSLEGEVFEGHVAAIIRQADPMARAFPVQVRLKNRMEGDDVLINPGMLARVQLPLRSAEQALLVPKDAIVLGGRSPRVFAVQIDSPTAEAGTVRAVPVELGLTVGSLIAVKGNLAVGDQVVVHGNERLNEGQAVRVVERLLAQDTGAP